MRWDWMKMAAISECLAQAVFPLDVFELKAAQSKVRASPACPGHDYDDLVGRGRIRHVHGYGVVV